MCTCAVRVCYLRVWAAGNFGNNITTAVAARGPREKNEVDEVCIRARVITDGGRDSSYGRRSRITRGRKTWCDADDDDDDAASSTVGMRSVDDMTVVQCRAVETRKWLTVRRLLRGSAAV